MNKVKRCNSPACQGTALRRSDIESSLSVERWDCPRCGKPYHCPTALTPITQAASTASALAIVATFALHLVTMDWDGAIEHAGENLDQLLG